MPPRQKSLTRGRWSSIALSFLLHSAIVVSAVVAWKYWKRTPPPVETVAIEGTLVDESALKGARPAPPPEPEPLPTPEPEEQGPPKPDPAEIERRQEEDRKAQEKVEQDKLEQQKREQEQKA
jgi:outer membrane biosynthesis protein TonB